MCATIAKEVERLAEEGWFEEIPEQTHVNLGYGLSREDNSIGIDFITGGDHVLHDGGVFCQVGKLNISSPSERKTQSANGNQ